MLIGWQLTLAEYLGGLVMIALIATLARVFISPRVEREAREHARRADTGHAHHAAVGHASWRSRLTSVPAWSDVAFNFRADWRMVYREILTGGGGRRGRRW